MARYKQTIYFMTSTRYRTSRLLRSLFTLLLAAGLWAAFAHQAHAQYNGGSGTPADPFQIATVQQLQNMQNNLNSHFILLNDIDASATANWNANTTFQQEVGVYDNFGLS